MEHTSHPDEHQTYNPHHTSKSHKERTATAERISAFLHGLLFLGSAYLLGTCRLPFGAFPLGISLLCAASLWMPYIYIGLMLSVFHPAFPLPFWAGWIVYTLTLLFRLMFAFLSGTPNTPHTQKKSPSALKRISSLTEFLWGGGASLSEDLYTDYYAGKRNIPMKPERALTPNAPSDTVVFPLFFRESSPLRLLSAALGAFALQLWVMVLEDFAFYDLLAFFVALCAAPLFAYLLSFCFQSEGQALLFSTGMPDEAPRRGHIGLLENYSFLPLISALLLLCFSTLAARAHVISLLPPYIVLHLSPILALLFAFHTTAGRGMIPGLIVAIVCGLAADPMLSPALILGVMAYAALRFISLRVAAVGGSCAAIAWTALVGSIGNFVAYVPSLMLALPLCLVMQKISIRYPSKEQRAGHTEAMQDFASAMEQKTRAEAHRSRLEALSGAFSSLSRMFYELSGQLRKPQMPELRRMCEEVFDRHCARCPHREVCKEADPHPADLLSARISLRLYQKGKASLQNLPPESEAQCLHLPHILEEINTRCAKLCEHLMKSEKTEVFAADYESMAHLIRNTLEEDEDEYRCNRVAADRIFDWLTAHGVAVMGVVVCGKRSCRIIVRGLHFEKEINETFLQDVRREFEDICATRLSPPTFESEEDSATTVMRLSSVPAYDAVYAGSTVPAGEADCSVSPTMSNEQNPDSLSPAPETCGDHIALFKSDSACFYALISDGMGSGETASLTSEICALFLEKMLSAGNRVELSVRMLNSLIRQKNSGTGDECSATVDLMELDLMSGQAVFVKNGAAPTYVVRGGKVYKIRSRTLPIGILSESEPEFHRFKMHPGDVVVMVSDGVTHGNDECPWLVDLLSSPLPQSMDSLRMRILRHAIASGSPDDLSAIAVRVEETKERDAG